MNLIDFAKEIETEGMQHYKKLSLQIPLKELADIFSFLSDEENRHLEMFEALKKGVEVPPLAIRNILGESKKVFGKITDRFNTLGVAARIHNDAYAKALRLEEKSVWHYKDALSKFDSPRQKNALKRIITQENTHISFLSSLIELLRHPVEWVENAGWDKIEFFPHDLGGEQLYFDREESFFWENRDRKRRRSALAS